MKPLSEVTSFGLRVRDRCRRLWSYVRGDLREELGSLATSFLVAVTPKLLAFVAAIMLIAAFFGENPITDLLQQHANERTDYPEISARGVVVLLVDDKTLLASDAEQLESGRIACLAHQIAQAQPRVIGLDYIFGALPDSQAVEDCQYGTGQSVFPLDRIAGVPVVTASLMSLTSGRLSETTSSPEISSRKFMNWGHALLNESMATPTVREISHIERYGADDYPIVSFSLMLSALASQTTEGSPRFANGRDLRSQLRQCATESSDCLELFSSNVSSSHALRFHDPYKALRIESAFSLLHGPCADPNIFHASCAPIFEDKVVILGDANRYSDDQFLSPLTTNLPFFGQLRYLSQTVRPISGTIFHAMATQNLLSGQALRQRTVTRAALASLGLFAVLPTLAVFIWILRGFRAGRPSRAILLDYAVTALAAVLLSTAVVIYALYMMVDRAQEVPLSFYLPAIIFGLALALSVTRVLNKLDRSARGNYLARHLISSNDHVVSETADEFLETPLSAASILIWSDTSDLSRSMAVEMSQIQDALKKWAKTQLSAVQAKASVFAFLDNWAFNRAAIYLFIKADKFSPGTDATKAEVLDSLVNQFLCDFGASMTRCRKPYGDERWLNRSHLGPVRGDLPLAVTIGFGSIIINDLTGSAEKDVLTVSGRLLDRLVTAASDQAIDTIRVVR